MITLMKKHNVYANGIYVALPDKIECYPSLDAAKEFMSNEFYNDESNLAAIYEETTLANGNIILSIKDRAKHILISLKTQENKG